MSLMKLFYQYHHNFCGVNRGKKEIQAICLLWFWWSHFFCSTDPQTMTVASPLHSVVIRGLKRVVEWLRFYSTLHYSASPQSCVLIPAKETYFRFWTGFLFAGMDVTFVWCMGLSRDKIFAGFLMDSDKNKSLIMSSLTPF